MSAKLLIDTLIEKVKNGTGDSDRHLLSLFGICLGSKGKKFLELGVRNGDTTLPILLAAHELGGTLTSVDIKKGSFNIPDNLLSNWEFIESDAISFLKSVPEKTFYDVIYIDDWHSYDHVKQELEILDKHTSPGGIILLHDLMYGNSCPYYHCDLTLAEGQWANGGP